MISYHNRNNNNTFHSRPSSGGADLERVGFALFVMAARKDGKAFPVPTLEIREGDTLAATRSALAAESKAISIAAKEVIRIVKGRVRRCEWRQAKQKRESCTTYLVEKGAC